MPNDKVIEYFLEYAQGPVVTIQGFKKFLVMEKKFCPSLLKELNYTLIDYPETLQFIRDVSEGHIVDNAMQGLLSVPMSQFILKNKYGYSEKTSDSIGDEGVSGTMTITIHKDT